MTYRRHWGLLLVGVLLVQACSSDGSSDSADDGVRDAVLGTPSTTTTTPPAVTESASLAGLGGLIAATGRAGLQLVDPTTGITESEFVPDGIVTQPTWSRDGTKLVAMALDPVTGEGEILLVDAAAGTSREVAAIRHYFFFSWSADGSKIAALRPGSVTEAGQMTSLDILDADGRLISRGSLEGGSLYVAWEPDGDSMLAHQDERLLLIDDPTDLASIQVVGSPGGLFQAPAWVPGTRGALIISQSPEGGAVTVVDVDTDDKIDYGPSAGFVNFAVTTDGLTAALGHFPDESTTTSVGFDTGQSSQGRDPQPATEISAVVEVVDLSTGERTAVSDTPALWLEWNPAGDALIVLHIDATWSVWSSGTSRSFTAAQPTNVFLTNYVFFSGQYIETPRLWSPDGTAITYSGISDDGDRFFVVPIGEDEPLTAVDVGPGHVAFWSPG